MKVMIGIAALVGALVLGCMEVHAMAWGGGRSNGGDGGAGIASSSSVSASVPEPSALYAVGSALALLGGAGWYIRRRK